MADKEYALTFALTNGTSKTVRFTAPQGDKGDTGAAGNDGISPAVTVTEIDGGHRVTITDAKTTHSFDVMDGDIARSGLRFELDDGTILY